jgi:hypothetical protein
MTITKRPVTKKWLFVTFGIGALLGVGYGAFREQARMDLVRQCVSVTRVAALVSLPQSKLENNPRVVPVLCDSRQNVIVRLHQSSIVGNTYTVDCKNPSSTVYSLPVTVFYWNIGSAERFDMLAPTETPPLPLSECRQFGFISELNE